MCSSVDYAFGVRDFARATTRIMYVPSKHNFFLQSRIKSSCMFQLAR